MTKNKLWLFLTIFAVIALMTGAAYATSYHSAAGGSITLYTSPGVAATANDAYSPKATCARACHTVPDGVEFAGHTYGTGSDTVPKNQGVITSTGSTYSENYTVAAYAHGVSVGRHMNQGRNEPYNSVYKGVDMTNQRSAFGDPFFVSSPGMWGKY